MMSLQEMFYGDREEVWVIKPDKKEEVKKGEAPPPKPPPTQQEINYGPFVPHYQKPYTAPPAEPQKKAPPPKTLELWVDICCEACEEEVKFALSLVKEVKKITCDIPKKKVTLVITPETKEDDIVLVCRKKKPFKKSRLWTKDD